MEDMRDVYSRTSVDLKKKLSETTLSQEQKDLVRTAMEFGHSAAFCSRTSDMHGGMFQAERYDSGYKSMKELVE